MAVSADALYHVSNQRVLSDVLYAFVKKKQLDQAGYILSRNAERHLIARDEVERRWRHMPEALEGTRILADLCCFSMDDLSYEYPDRARVWRKNNYTRISISDMARSKKALS